jgi:molybdate transport repressor ModE-like protein
MLKSTAPMVVPETRHVNGYPLLLDTRAMEFLLSQPDFAAAEEAVRKGAIPVESVLVEDSGILLRGSDMTHKQPLIRNHNSQLTRPVTETTLCTGSVLFDARLSMLLHLVEDTRSVREACNLMQISYSTAWNMLNHVEDELGYPLITRIRGGCDGSGSILTEKGRMLMSAYDQFSAQLNLAAKELYEQFFTPFTE